LHADAGGAPRAGAEATAPVHALSVGVTLAHPSFHRGFLFHRRKRTRSRSPLPYMSFRRCPMTRHSFGRSSSSRVLGILSPHPPPTNFVFSSGPALGGHRLVATLIKHALPGTPGVPTLLDLCVAHVKNHYSDSLAPLVSLLPAELQQMIVAAREKGSVALDQALGLKARYPTCLLKAIVPLPGLMTHAENEALVCLRKLSKSQPKVVIPMTLGAIQHWLDHSGPWQCRSGPMLRLQSHMQTLVFQ
jgi:hypothetical protein